MVEPTKPNPCESRNKWWMFCSELIGWVEISVWFVVPGGGEEWSGRDSLEFVARVEDAWKKPLKSQTRYVSNQGCICGDPLCSHYTVY